MRRAKAALVLGFGTHSRGQSPRFHWKVLQDCGLIIVAQIPRGTREVAMRALVIGGDLRRSNHAGRRSTSVAVAVLYLNATGQLTHWAGDPELKIVYSRSLPVPSLCHVNLQSVQRLIAVNSQDCPKGLEYHK